MGTVSYLKFDSITLEISGYTAGFLETQLNIYWEVWEHIGKCIVNIGMNSTVMKTYRNFDNPNNRDFQYPNFY